MTKLSALFPALFVLAACDAPPPVRPDPPDASCPAEALQHLVGQPESAFDPGAIEGPVRVIRPGDAVTADFSLKRLNVEIGPDRRIVAIRCG